MIWILIYEMPGLFELVHTSREDELLLLFINQNDCRETGATELQLIHSQFLQSVNFAKKKDRSWEVSYLFSSSCDDI